MDSDEIARSGRKVFVGNITEVSHAMDADSKVVGVNVITALGSILAYSNTVESERRVK